MFSPIKSRGAVHTPITYKHSILFSIILLASIFLSACGASSTPTPTQPPTAAPAATQTQEIQSPTNTTQPTNTPLPSSTATLQPSATSTLTLVPSSTTAPSATATPANTSTQGPAPTRTIAPFLVDMVSDIQNHVNGVIQVLNISADNGEAYIIIRNAYTVKADQYKASYNLVYYLATTYFKGFSNSDLASKFNGTQFSLHIKSLANNNEYIVETQTPYAVLVQVAQGAADMGQWEALVDAQIQMQYGVHALCSVSPDIVDANTDTDLVVSASLSYLGEPVLIQAVNAAWKDSDSVQNYCTSRPYSTVCHGKSGNVASGSKITIDVTILAFDGLSYTCQTTVSAP
jgi:hypothetical protein